MVDIFCKILDSTPIKVLRNMLTIKITGQTYPDQNLALATERRTCPLLALALAKKSSIMSSLTYQGRSRGFEVLS